MSVSLSSKSIQLVGVIPFYTNHATYVGASISLGVAASKTKPRYDWYVDYAGMVIPQAPDNWRANMSDTEVADLYIFKHCATFRLYFRIMPYQIPTLWDGMPEIERGVADTTLISASAASA